MVCAARMPRRRITGNLAAPGRNRPCIPLDQKNAINQMLKENIS